MLLGVIKTVLEILTVPMERNVQKNWKLFPPLNNVLILLHYLIWIDKSMGALLSV